MLGSNNGRARTVCWRGKRKSNISDCAFCWGSQIGDKWNRWDYTACHLRIPCICFNESAFRLGDPRDPELDAIGKALWSASCNRSCRKSFPGKAKDKWLSTGNDILDNSSCRYEIANYILQQSYNDLPPHLEACIGYSLFPEEFAFNTQDLID